MEKSITVVVTQQPTTNFVKYQYFIEATNLSIKVPPIKLVKLTPVFCLVFQFGGQIYGIIIMPINILCQSFDYR